MQPSLTFVADKSVAVGVFDKLSIGQFNVNSHWNDDNTDLPRNLTVYFVG